MNREQLQKLSRLRLREARVLLQRGHFEGAYYLLGYAIECALKAAIAKQVHKYDFPDKKTVNDSYSHDLEKLLGVAGLRDNLKKDMKSSRVLSVNWATVKDWSEEARYRHSISEKTARDFYSACTSRKHGVLSWLRSSW